MRTIQLGMLDLRPGDDLLLQVIDAGPPEPSPAVRLEMTIPIVAEAVIPLPATAYALLRAERSADGEILTVRTARFDWNPPATRVDLVDPADLAQSFVRRRAVFQWTDSVRRQKQTGQAASQHAVQKIHPTGATHFPPFT